MPEFPNQIDEFRTFTNLPGMEYDAARSDIAFAEDLNKIVTSINSIETSIGIQPTGEFIPLLTRFETIEAEINAINTRTNKLGYAQITTDGSTTSSSLAPFSVTSLAVTFTAPGGRDVKVTVCGAFSGVNGGYGYGIGIKEGSTILGRCLWTSAGAQFYEPVTRVFVVTAPTSGDHTYTVCGSSDGGTFYIRATEMAGNNTAGPASILVEAM